jgi:glutathione S-transferase
MVGFPFADYPSAPTPATYERVLAECRGPRGLIGRYAVKWEAMLQQSDGPFFLGASPSIADVGVFEAIDYFRDVFGAGTFDESFAPFPHLLKHYATTREL